MAELLCADALEVESSRRELLEQQGRRDRRLTGGGDEVLSLSFVRTTNPMMRYHVSDSDPAEWDGLVQHFPDRTVFHTLAWLRAIEQTSKLKLTLLKASTQDTCVAVWPLLTMRKGPFRIVGSPLQGWSTPYLGPLFAAESDTRSVLAALCAQPVVRRAAYCHCKVIDAGRNVDMSSVGFEPIKRYRTYLLNLERTEEELWKGLEKRCKEAIRKGRRAGLVVGRLEGHEFVDEFWGMLSGALARHGLKPSYSRSFIECAVSNLEQDGRLLALSAAVNGRSAAMLITAHDGQTLHPIASASAVSCRRLSPGNTLWWETMVEARRMGLNCFDMSAVYSGPGKFRRSFGPEARDTATHWERTRSRLIVRFKRCYEIWAKRKLRVPVASGEPRS